VFTYLKFSDVEDLIFEVLPYKIQEWYLYYLA
jgi:hypothetical protein